MLIFFVLVSDVFAFVFSVFIFVVDRSCHMYLLKTRIK